jgi:hypothetical protein
MGFIDLGKFFIQAGLVKVVSEQSHILWLENIINMLDL